MPLRRQDLRSSAATGVNRLDEYERLKRGHILDSSLTGSTVNGNARVSRSEIVHSTLNGGPVVENSTVTNSTVNGMASIVGRRVEGVVLNN